VYCSPPIPHPLSRAAARTAGSVCGAWTTSHSRWNPSKSPPALCLGKGREGGCVAKPSERSCWAVAPSPSHSGNLGQWRVKSRCRKTLRAEQDTRCCARFSPLSEKVLTNVKHSVNTDAVMWIKYVAVYFFLSICLSFFGRPLNVIYWRLPLVPLPEIKGRRTYRSITAHPFFFLCSPFFPLYDYFPPSCLQKVGEILCDASLNKIMVPRLISKMLLVFSETCKSPPGIG